MEIVLVLVIALLVLGPNRLPQAGRTLGRAVREFRHATDRATSELGLDEVIEEFKGVRDGLTSDFQGVKDDVNDNLNSTGVTGAMSAIKAGMSIDLKNPVSMAKTVMGTAAGSGAAAAVDKPVQVTPVLDDDSIWPEGVTVLPADDGAPPAAAPGNGSQAGSGAAAEEAPSAADEAPSAALTDTDVPAAAGLDA
jgi:TatA/E family protein of Tat protein translocase